MRGHTANELLYVGDILAADGVTVLTQSVRCGVRDLSGRVREQAQLVKPESSHMILFRTADATGLTEAGYVQVNGVLYIVDYILDAGNAGRAPRPGMWTETYAHVERTGN